MTVAPAPQGPLLMCAEAFRGSDRKYWARWPFHVISVCFPFTQRKRKWAEGTPNPFVDPASTWLLSSGPTHQRVYLCLYRGSHGSDSNAAQMCSDRHQSRPHTSAVPGQASTLAPRGAPCASVSIHAVSGVCQSCPLKKYGFFCNKEPSRAADPFRLSPAETQQSSRKMVSAFRLEVCSM